MSLDGLLSRIVGMLREERRPVVVGLLLLLLVVIGVLSWFYGVNLFDPVVRTFGG